jgi:hypothetical protein
MVEGYPEVFVCFLGVNTRPQEKVRGQLTISFSLRDDVNCKKKKTYSKSNDTVHDKVQLRSTNFSPTLP